MAPVAVALAAGRTEETTLVRPLVRAARVVAPRGATAAAQRPAVAPQPLELAVTPALAEQAAARHRVEQAAARQRLGPAAAQRLLELAEPAAAPELLEPAVALELLELAEPAAAPEPLEPAVALELLEPAAAPELAVAAPCVVTILTRTRRGQPAPRCVTAAAPPVCAPSAASGRVPARTPAGSARRATIATWSVQAKTPARR